MNDLFERFGPILLVLGVGAGVLAFAFRRASRRVSAKHQPRSWLDYILVWPLLFEISSTVDRSRRLLTNREIVGWLVFALILIIGLVYF